MHYFNNSNITKYDSYPENVALRISFVFFLLERMKYKQQALQELISLEKNKPSFDVQFIIFRYKSSFFIK